MHLDEQVPSPQVSYYSRRAPQTKRKRSSLAERFWAKVIVHKGSCWEWTGATNVQGYGHMYAHRYEDKLGAAETATHVSWFIHYGVWPQTNLLHSCDNPPCTNPHHLSEGSLKENMRQAKQRMRFPNQHKTHCPKGHPYDEEHTYIKKNGGRQCKTCHNIRTAQDYRDDREEEKKTRTARYKELKLTNVHKVPCAHCSQEVPVYIPWFKRRTKLGQKNFFCDASCTRRYHLAKKEAAG